MKSKAYINGRFVPEDKAAVSVFDRGLNYGDGLFETLKAVDGRVEYLKEHLKRLKKGCSVIGIPLSDIKKLINDVKAGAIERLIKENGLARGPAYARITVTRGADRAGHLPSKGLKPASIIITKPVDGRAISRLQSKGAGAIFLRDFRPTLPGIKSLNYLPNVLGKVEAVRRKSYEGIFVGPGQCITEGTSSNIFIVRGGGLKTPPAGEDVFSTALPGIIRERVIRITEAQGLKVSEERITIADLLRCEEAFLTNSIIGIAPLIKAGGAPIGSGKPGDLTRSLQGLLKTGP